MHCPQCGQRQVSDQLRFCSRCGFPLDGVIQLLGNGGVLPAALVDKGERKLTPRQLGVRQGAMLMLSTLLVVPVTALISINFTEHPEIFIPLAAILCFVGGLLRLVYALLFEADAPRVKQPAASSYVAPAMTSQLDAQARTAALPPPSSPGTPASGWRRPDTAELVQPPSVAEHTTRLLDDKADPNRS